MSKTFNTNPLTPSSPNFDSLAGNVLNSTVGGITAQARFAKAATGSRCILKINKKLFAFAFSINWRIDTVQDEIWTIDDYTPYELAPKKVMVSGTIGSFHVPGKSPTIQLVQPNVLSFMMHKYITIEVRDRTTDQLMFLTNKAVITSRYQENNAGDLSQMQLQFKAIGWQDEMVPNFPNGVTGEDTSSGGLLGQAVDAVGNFFG